MNAERGMQNEEERNGGGSICGSNFYAPNSAFCVPLVLNRDTHAHA